MYIISIKYSLYDKFICYFINKLFYFPFIQFSRLIYAQENHWENQ